MLSRRPKFLLSWRLSPVRCRQRHRRYLEKCGLADLVEAGFWLGACCYGSRIGDGGEFIKSESRASFANLRRVARWMNGQERQTFLSGDQAADRMWNFQIAQIHAARGYKFDRVRAVLAESGYSVGERRKSAVRSKRCGSCIAPAAIRARTQKSFFAPASYVGRKWGGALRDSNKHAALRGDDVLYTL